MKILQVGLGNFGRRHMEAWHRLGLGEQLWIAELDENKWQEGVRYNFPRGRFVRSATEVLDQVQVVDVVTPTEGHFDLCRMALLAGKDVFVEKPMTMTSDQARQLVELAKSAGRLLQVGFYYRFHPISRRLSRELRSGRFGGIRYVSGSFCGFKRARTDVGVTHTDGIHFLDLFNWLLGGFPEEVYAVCRDHFGRRLEDLSIVIVTYPGGTLGKIESGYIQPGRWKDKVVPGALTTKAITIVGERATAEADFEAETLTLYDAHHELRDGVWSAVVGDATQLPIEPCDPVQMVCRELEAFLRSVESREPPSPGPVESGLHLAMLIEHIYESARSRIPVKVRLVEGERG